MKKGTKSALMITLAIAAVGLTAYAFVKNKQGQPIFGGKTLNDDSKLDKTRGWVSLFIDGSRGLSDLIWGNIQKGQDTFKDDASGGSDPDTNLN